jgi:PEP-CTERM motif
MIFAQRLATLALSLSCAAPISPAAAAIEFGNTNGGNGTLSGAWPSFSITGSDFNEPGHGEALTYYQALITIDTLVTASWSYTTTETGTDGSAYDPAGWFIETAYGRSEIQLTDDALTAQSGLQIIPLHAGERFGWFVHSLDQDAGAATLSVDMALAEDISEPATAWMMLAGGGLLAFVRRTRHHKIGAPLRSTPMP